MDSKVFMSGSIGFASGVVVTLLISLLFMGGMRWRGGMMHGWRCDNWGALNSPMNETVIPRQS